MSTTPPSPNASPPWPIYDLFLDLPHPAASSSCPGPFLIPSPVKNPIDLKTVTVPQVTRFAFPECNVDAIQQHQQSSPSSSMNRHDMYAMQNPFTQFSQFTFSLQLDTGVRLHGHVRRYMPPHLVARTRYDVGRRGERALVLITRATGADALYAAMLKSIEAISSQQAALSAAGKTVHGGNPQQWFLHQLSRYQQYLSQVYASQPAQGKPLLASISGLELGDHLPAFKQHDVHRFLIPTALLKQQTGSSSDDSANTNSIIVPLLRCIGVPHTLRLLSALLSERRVVLLSASPTRLTVCSQAAIGLLGAGALNFHHVYIPVLPPHLTPYLAAPYPYLIGLLGHALPPTDGLGEVVVMQLDTNVMTTHNIPDAAVAERVPDLCAATMGDPMLDQQQQQPVSFSCADVLANELITILKNDKKVLFGDSLDKKVGEAAGKAKAAVKKTFYKLREKSRQYLRGEAGDGAGSAEDVPEPPPQQHQVDDSMASDYIFTEGCHNEIAENEARIALACFYLALYGNPRIFFSLNQQQKPVLDRKKFLQHHRYAQGSPLFQLLHNFCQTQMLEEYAIARGKDTGAMSPDASLFLQCMSYCAQHPEYFSSGETLHRVVEQFADRIRGTPTNARRTAMFLTANKAMDTDNSRAIAQLIGECRESTCILLDVMSVIWLRVRDCKGLQYKHGYLALSLLRDLLYHGPMAAITEATDGLSKIRALKFYDNGVRSQWSTQVRGIAVSVYGLLVDRAKLFAIRRLCAERRRAMQSSTEPKRLRNTKTSVTTPFRNIHAMMHPAASSGTVVQIPPKQQIMSRGDGSPQGVAPASNATSDNVVDLFGTMSFEANNAPAPAPNPFDGFASPTPPAPAVPQHQYGGHQKAPLSPVPGVHQHAFGSQLPQQGETREPGSRTPPRPQVSPMPQQFPQGSQTQQQLSPGLSMPNTSSQPSLQTSSLQLQQQSISLHGQQQGQAVLTFPQNANQYAQHQAQARPPQTGQQAAPAGQQHNQQQFPHGQPQFAQPPQQQQLQFAQPVAPQQRPELAQQGYGPAPQQQQSFNRQPPQPQASFSLQQQQQQQHHHQQTPQGPYHQQRPGSNPFDPFGK